MISKQCSRRIKNVSGGKFTNTKMSDSNNRTTEQLKQIMNKNTDNDPPKK